MKAKILTATVFAAGVLVAAAQSNPSSTNGVDTEVELSWPNGTVYLSSYNVNDYLYSGDPLVLDTYNNCNWSETGGGTAYYVSTGYSSQQSTNEVTWPGSSWPVWLDGEIISLDGGGTNYDAGPPGTSYPLFPITIPFSIGSVNFYVAETPSYGPGLYNYNEQPQLTLVTGGMPGTTGSELFGISASGLNRLPSEYNIPNQQIQISSFGSLNTNGEAFAVLPLHTQVPITPSVSSASYYQVSLGVQAYQLISQCVATTPANQARTTVGVGEQVNLSFSPTLPINAVWSTTAGSLSYTNKAYTQFTAPDYATTATVTATVQGQSVGMSFNIIAPNGMITAEITGTNHYSVGSIAAGMTNLIIAYPTNVSFYNVELTELTCSPTNITGYYTNVAFNPISEGSAILGYDNTFIDKVNAGLSDPYLPLSSGGYDIDVPVVWQVLGSSVTNNFGTFNNQIRLLDSSGNFSDTKYGITITRSTNDVSYSSQ